MPLDRERINELLETFRASDAAELVIQEGDRYYRFVRRAAGAEAPSVALETNEGQETIAAPAAQMPLAALEDVTIYARVVGLFYRGRQPGDDPLVRVGDQVEEGQPLGIVEVLRKPTTIVSPVKGTVSEIVHEDGHGVQYGDRLFVIRPE